MAPKSPPQLVFEALRDNKWDKAVKTSKLEGYTSTGLLAAVRRISPFWKPLIEPIVVNAIRAGASQALCLIADAYGSLPDPDLQGTQYYHLLLALVMREDRADVFTALLDHGVLPTEPDHQMGRSLLMVAVESKATECVRVCLERRVCSLEERDSQGYTALLVCACAGTAEILRLLAESGCDLLAKTDSGAHALSCAAAFVHIDIMEALLDLGFPIDMLNEGISAFHKVALVEEPAKLAGATAAARLLLDRGAGIHACATPLNWTPLHFVGQSGNLALAKLLLERGASVSPEDDEGLTPLHIAARSGHVTLMALLISKGADINSLTYRGYTPLITAITEGKADAVRLLVRAGCDLSKRATLANEPCADSLVAATFPDVNVLHIAVIHTMQLSDFEAIASCLVQARPQLLEESDGDGFLPLHRCVLAALQDESARVKVLLSLGADIDACTAVAFDNVILCRTADGSPSTTVVRTKKSALLLAAELGRQGVVQWLLNGGANVHVGSSPEGEAEGPGTSLALDLLGWLESSREQQPAADLPSVTRSLLTLWYFGAVPQRRPLSSYESVSGMQVLGANIEEMKFRTERLEVREVQKVPDFRRAVADLRKAASAAVPEVYQLYFRPLLLLSYRPTRKPFEDYLASRGALPLLAGLLAAPQPLVQEYAALCLSRLAESRSAAAHLSRVQGIVSGLVGLLSPGRRPAATHWACRCLFELCQTPLGKARFLWGLGELGTGPAGAGAELPKGISLGPGDPDASAAGGGDGVGTSPGRRNVTAVLSLLSREGCWPATREWAAQCLLVALRTPHVPSPSQEAPAWSLEGSGAGDGPGDGPWAGLVKRREVLASAARAAGAVLGPAGLALLRSSLSMDTLAGLVEEEGLYSESGSVLRLASWL